MEYYQVDADIVGYLEGDNDGGSDVIVGALDGDVVGCFVGDKEWAMEGISVGFNVGTGGLYVGVLMVTLNDVLIEIQVNLMDYLKVILQDIMMEQIDSIQE